MHVAFFDNGNIIEAQGRVSNNYKLEVLKRNIQDSCFYKTGPECEIVNDWVVMRVKDEYQQLVPEALQYASEKAYDPNVHYVNNFYDPQSKNQDQLFYCSLLVWKAFFRLGLNLDYDNGFAQNAPVYSLLNALTNQVLPDDLYASSKATFAPTKVVQTYPGLDNIRRSVYSMWSPAHILVTDALGRQIGYDPASGSAINQIPGAYYSGTNSEPEWVSGNIPGPVKVDVYGVGAGPYSLAVRGFEATASAGVFNHRTTIGQHDVFSIPANAVGDQITITPVQLQVRHDLYLPLVQR